LNSKVKSFIKKFLYTLSSNFISLIISTLVVLIVPKFISVEDYGYWQLFLFYSSYVGFFHFGWNDGIYLRYGGIGYRELNKTTFFSQFYMLILLQLMIAVIISFIGVFFLKDDNKSFIILMTALSMIIVNVRHMLLMILQATNRMEEAAKINIFGRTLFSFMIIVFIFVGFRQYKLMILSEIIGNLISLFYAMYCCRDMLFRKISNFYFNLKEVTENISVGIKLMFANIASMLIIGTVRFGIERSWDVTTFGKVSLILSISNLMMLFINAVGLIMFPILRRTDEKRLPIIYSTLRDFLMAILLGVLIVYYPLKIILSTWLPAYEDSLIYMSLLFPIFIYEGKMALLINTYLKTLRKEKQMLRINLISFILSLSITFITTIYIKNLELAILSIVILLMFRSILSEVFLSKVLSISIYKDIFLEVIITIIFIVTAWFMNSWIVPLIYSIFYFSYITIKRKDIINTMKEIKLLLNS
jgi:O-antigen/teichoic acid export membrane protein